MKTLLNIPLLIATILLAIAVIALSVYHLLTGFPWGNDWLFLAFCIAVVASIKILSTRKPN
jgi:uncharacterized membrane protein